MSLSPYLYFDGQCEEAFKFYEKCLGGKITFMMTYEGSPMAAHYSFVALSRLRKTKSDLPQEEEGATPAGVELFKRHEGKNCILEGSRNGDCVCAVINLGQMDIRVCASYSQD